MNIKLVAASFAILTSFVEVTTAYTSGAVGNVRANPGEYNNIRSIVEALSDKLDEQSNKLDEQSNKIKEQSNKIQEQSNKIKEQSNEIAILKRKSKIQENSNGNLLRGLSEELSMSYEDYSYADDQDNVDPQSVTIAQSDAWEFDPTNVFGTFTALETYLEKFNDVLSCVSLDSDKCYVGGTNNSTVIIGGKLEVTELLKASGGVDTVSIGNLGGTEVEVTSDLKVESMFVQVYLEVGNDLGVDGDINVRGGIDTETLTTNEIEASGTDIDVLGLLKASGGIDTGTLKTDTIEASTVGTSIDVNSDLKVFGTTTSNVMICEGSFTAGDDSVITGTLGVNGLEVLNGGVLDISQSSSN